MTWQNPLGDPPPNWPGWFWQNPPQPVPYVAPTTKSFAFQRFDVQQYEIFLESTRKLALERIKDQINLENPESLRFAERSVKAINKAFEFVNEHDEETSKLERLIDHYADFKDEYDEVVLDVMRSKVEEAERLLEEKQKKYEQVERSFVNVLIALGLRVEGYSQPRTAYDIQVNWAE